MPATPFTDPALVAGPLYATADRLARRTGALHAAKIHGDDATTTIVGLAARSAPSNAVVADIGCGRGSTTVQLAQRLTPARLIAIDQSAALLDIVESRMVAAGRQVETRCADFHHLPLPDASVDIAVAAFCLYHSPHPEQVVVEIARCLAPAGTAVLVTKSADSYHEIDQLLAETGLDPQATSRASLYETFHSATAADIVRTTLDVADVVHQPHVFEFRDLDHLADYVTTSPKYHLPGHLAGNPDALADALRQRMADRPIIATSTVTYVTASRP